MTGQLSQQLILIFEKISKKSFSAICIKQKTENAANILAFFRQTSDSNTRGIIIAGSKGLFWHIQICFIYLLKKVNVLRVCYFFMF